MSAISPVDSSDKHDVFISYSRRDGEFVQKLHDALQAEGQNPWIDWVNIPKGVDWWQCIQSGIESAYTFVFVISPDSVTSKICQDELEYALQFNKRLLPVVWRMPEFDQIPDALKRINWNSIAFDQSFDGALVQLLEGINADLDHIKEHTYLLERALTWERNSRSKDSLLVGSELNRAKNWMVTGAAKTPQPTQLQVDYITNSYEKDFLTLAAAKQKRKFWTIAAVVSLMALVSGITVSSKLAELNALVSSLQDQKGLDALLVALKTGKEMQEGGWLYQRFAPELPIQTVTALQQEINQLREINRLEGIAGHKGRVYQVSFSPDGKLLASASQDGSVKLWQADGTLINTLFGHQAEVVGIVFNPGSSEVKDGVKITHQLLASASYDKTIKLYQIDTYLDITNNSKDKSATQAPIRVEAKLLKTLINDGHSDKIYSISTDPGGTMLASASSDGTAKLWDWQGKLLRTLQHGQPGVLVTGVSFSPYGDELATAGVDGTVKRWSKDGKLLSTLKQGSPVFSLSYSPKDKLLAIGDLNGTLKLWQPDGTNQSLPQHEDAIQRISFSPNGQKIATASADGTARLWSPNGELLQTLRGHRNEVYRVQFSPDGRVVATAGADDTVKLWATEDGTLLDSLEGHRDEVLGIAFSPPSGEQPMIASASADSSIKLWKLESPVEVLPHGNRVYKVAFRPGDSILASGSLNTIRLWGQDGTPISNVKAHEGQVSSLSFSSDKGLLASAGFNGQRDSEIKLWRIGGSKLLPVTTLAQQPSAVKSLEFVPNHALLASVGEDGAIRFWQYPKDKSESEKGQQVYVEERQGQLTSLSFSPDGTMMLTTSKAVVGRDGLVKLWKLKFNQNDIPTATLLKTLEAHQGDVLTASFSHDGKRFATAGTDQVIRLWRSDGTAISVFSKKHSKPITSVSFSPDGRLIASASQDSSVKLWTTEGSLISTLNRHRREVSSLSFSSSDSRILASASYDKQVLLWQIPTGFAQNARVELLKQGCDAAQNYLNQNSTKEANIKDFCNQKYLRLLKPDRSERGS